MKICGKCKQEKQKSEFYKHKRDGLQSICKDCKREQMRAYNKTPKRREYNRKVAIKLKERGYFKEYSNRKDVKERQAMRMRELSKNPELKFKMKARRLARTALEQGKLFREKCVYCGDPNSHKHHSDYKKPLLVVWVCRKCHRKLHAKAKEA